MSDSKGIKAFDAKVASLEPMIKSFGQFYSNKQFSDLIIRHKETGQEWAAHKFLVCSHSEALKATLERGAQLEQVFTKNVIELDDEPHLIEAMLYFMYLFDYRMTKDNTGSDDESLVSFCAKLYVIADKYLIEHLKDFAAAHFEKLCAALKDKDGFTEALDAVYSSGGGHDRLKKIALAAAMDLPKLKYYNCPNCRKNFGIGDPAPAKFSCPSECYDRRVNWWDSTAPKA